MGKNAPSLKETAAFLEAAEESNPRDHALACLLALNGLALRSVCAARATDLDLDRQTLTVSLLGGAATPVPLAPRTCAAVVEQLEGRQQGPLLLDDDNSTPLSPAAAMRIVRRIARAAGLANRLDTPWFDEH